MFGQWAWGENAIKPEQQRAGKGNYGIAAFDKVKPKGANGAWEVFARYDMMNANTGTNITLTGGEDASVVTLGVNYYMNSNVKVAVNYVTAETDTKIIGEDDGDAIVGRLQFAF